MIIKIHNVLNKKILILDHLQDLNDEQNTMI